LVPAANESISRDRRFDTAQPRASQRTLVSCGAPALTDYDRLPVAHATFSRRNIFKRDHFACQHCGAQPGSEELTIDHVVSRAQGGVSSWENCVLACMACNKRKADRTPEQARMHLRKNPVRPTWKPPGTDAERWSADHSMRIESRSKFLSDAYWNVTLQE
jgi:hypothetical protein